MAKQSQTTVYIQMRHVSTARRTVKSKWDFQKYKFTIILYNIVCFFIPNPKDCIDKKKYLFRLIVGGQDGSVTILVVAQLEDEEMSEEETTAKTANYLKNLPSRRARHDQGAKAKVRKESVSSKEGSEEDTGSDSTLNTFEERMRDERRAEVRRRFR